MTPGLMPNHLRALDRLASKNWRVRQSPMEPDNPGEFILEADKLSPSHPYNIQVLGDDKHPELYPPKVARADAELMAILRNNLSTIIELLEKKS
jgi:hypothetical protein